MAEMVLHTRTLPQEILRLISTETVKIRKSGGEVHLIPVEDSANPQSILPILGMYTDGKLTVEGHLKRSREDKEIEK